MRARHLWAGIALALAVTTSPAQTPLPDQLGYVNDLAGAMSGDAASRLGEVLGNYGAESGIQIAVLTVENPVEESPEDLAGRALAIFLQGDSAQRGAMLVWTENGHVVVYVGEGLRREISDAEAQAIIDEAVIPAAASGDVDNALALGAYRLIESASEGAGETEDERPAQEPTLPVGVPPIALPEQAATALGQDLQILGGAFVDNPWTAATWFFNSVEAQAQALPATLAAQVPLIFSDANSIVFAAIALAVLAFTLNATWRLAGSLPVMGCALVMAGAAMIWLFTRFTELSLLVLLAGPIGLVAWFKWGRGDAAPAGPAPVAPQNAYAAWLAQQQAKQTTLRPPVSGAQPTSSAAATAIRTMPASAGGAATSPPAVRRMSEMLERAHAAGTATPAMDRVLARWRRITSADYKQQRTGMIVILILLALFFLPAAFLAIAGWIFSELNALKQPNQKLSEFFQQLSREMQALQRFQGHR